MAHAGDFLVILAPRGQRHHIARPARRQSAARWHRPTVNELDGIRRQLKPRTDIGDDLCRLFRTAVVIGAHRHRPGRSATAAISGRFAAVTITHTAEQAHQTPFDVRTQGLERTFPGHPGCARSRPPPVAGSPPPSAACDLLAPGRRHHRENRPADSSARARPDHRRRLSVETTRQRAATDRPSLRRDDARLTPSKRASLQTGRHRHHSGCNRSGATRASTGSRLATAGIVEVDHPAT